MESCAYCTAGSYQIKGLFESLRSHTHATLNRDSIHVQLDREHSPEPAHAFIFSFGALVFWGLSKEQEKAFIDEIKPFEKNPNDELVSEPFRYEYGRQAAIDDDTIVLPNDEILTKLAFSHGMAQSVKLEFLENMIERASVQLSHLPEDLARRGKIFLSRKQIRREMGNLFITRNSINLHIDVLDLPDFFWDYPDLEPYYTLISTDLNIKDRVEVLTRRLDNVHELYDMLANELNHQHSNRLEWIIIWLILVEVVLSLFHDILGII